MAQGTDFWFGALMEAVEVLLGDGDGGCGLCTLSALFQLAGVFQEGAYTFVWFPYFYSCCWGTHLYCLALVISKAYISRTYRTVTNRETAFKQLRPTEHNKRQQTREINITVEEAY